MEEEWADLPQYEGLYQVSSLGRVRGVKRGKVLAPATDNRGYLFVNLSKKGKVKVYKVHRLVALTFIGDRPEGQQVRHLDSCKTNNCRDNLAYGTVYQNNMDAYLAGRFRNKPVTARMKHRICALVASGVAQNVVATICSVSKSTVSKVVNKGKRRYSL